MSKRVTQRPGNFVKPPHWSTEPPPQARAADGAEELGPTRYGDWVRNGLAIDF
jgi:hypothetical protein